MVAIEANKLSLVYNIRRKLSLAPRDRRVPAGDNISGAGRHQAVTALEDISFSLSAGDRLGLVGTNGAGKTTLLKLLAGIYQPTSGELTITGRQDALFNISLGFRKEATGRRNIVLRGLINGWSKSEIHSKMDEIIDFSELGDFIDVPYKAYSQGMAARLAFSVATALNPEILLMDEWIGAGDTRFQSKARDRMNDLAENAGIIVLASHNHKLLRRTCNKILELDRGKIKAFQAADDWFNANPDPE